ncbi:hypothetical protein V499_09411 [Pseudogymnoascus sp. VKM F-103]|nr:hypothetical protein V499_09411 [Pseudogymnoascus sp. VKM F-103]
MAPAADTVGLVIGIFLAVGVVTMFSLFCYFRSHFQDPASMYYTEEGNGTELANAGASTDGSHITGEINGRQSLQR